MTAKGRTITGFNRPMQAHAGHRSGSRAFWRFCLFVLLLLTLSACDRLPLELYMRGDSEVGLTYNWTHYHGPTPNGLYVMYAKDGDSINITYPTHDLQGEDKGNMENGTYNMIVMTNTFGEYEGNMRFYNTRSYEKIMAVAEGYNIADQDAWDKGMRYMEEPMKLGVALDSFDVNFDNDGRIFYEYDQSDTSDTLRQKRELVVQPMTTTLTIRVKVRGIDYMKTPEFGGADGYITGLADGCYLTQLWRRSEVGNIKLNHWRYDSALTRAETGNVGWIVINIETFGLPHGRELLRWRTPQSNFIKLHFTLLDGRTKEFSYNVGKMIRYEGDDGKRELFTQADVELELNLEIDAPFVNDDDVPILPYAQPEGSGQFGADVAPWGDDIDLEIPM